MTSVRCTPASNRQSPQVMHRPSSVPRGQRRAQMTFMFAAAKRHTRPAISTRQRHVHREKEQTATTLSTPPGTHPCWRHGACPYRYVPRRGPDRNRLVAHAFWCASSALPAGRESRTAPACARHQDHRSTSPPKHHQRRQRLSAQRHEDGSGAVSQAGWPERSVARSRRGCPGVGMRVVAAGRDIC